MVWEFFVLWRVFHDVYGTPFIIDIPNFCMKKIIKNLE